MGLSAGTAFGKFLVCKFVVTAFWFVAVCLLWDFCEGLCRLAVALIK